MRSLTPEFIAATEESVVRNVVLAEIELASVTLRLTNNAHDLTWDTHTWLANGWLREIGAVRENPDTDAENLIVTLQGLPQSVVSIALQELNHSLQGTFYLALLDSSSAIIDDPIVLFRGFCDIPTLNDSATEGALAITYESELIRMDKSRAIRASHEAQQARFPGDRGFEYAALIEEWTGFWGKSQRESWVRRPQKPKQVRRR